MPSTARALCVCYVMIVQGFKNKLDVHLRRAVSESSNSTVEALYESLTNIISVKTGRQRLCTRVTGLSVMGVGVCEHGGAPVVVVSVCELVWTSGSVFHTGTWTYIDVDKSGTGWRLVAWRWGDSDGNKRLVVVNFSDTMGWGNVVVADATAPSGDTLTITELITGVQYERSASQMRTTGLVCGVEPFSAQIFEY
jgi:hypothetical protein